MSALAGPKRAARVGDALIAEPDEGWRAWRLALDRPGVSLVPIGRGESLGTGRKPLPPDP